MPQKTNLLKVSQVHFVAIKRTILTKHYDNIRVTKMGSTLDEVREAARKAEAHEFIKKLPMQYYTYLEEAGAGLSGGERHALSTELNIEDTKEGLLVAFSGEGNLPGMVSIQLFDYPTYKHIYLYNENRGQYEKLNTIYENNQFTIDYLGGYLLTAKARSTSTFSWIIIASIGAAVVVCVGAYIAVKKRHWFW